MEPAAKRIKREVKSEDHKPKEEREVESVEREVRSEDHKPKEEDLDFNAHADAVAVEAILDKAQVLKRIDPHRSFAVARADGVSWQFGPIPDVKVGKVFENRGDARLAGVHKEQQAGIAGTVDGCPSICINGGYDDNCDWTWRIIFTGAGSTIGAKRDEGDGDGDGDGDARGVTHTHMQWTSRNRALFRSYCESYPIRVLRGSKSKVNHAPREGYRYEGLYQVVRVFIERGVSGAKVINFAMERIAGQDPLRGPSGVLREPDWLRDTPASDWIAMSNHRIEVGQLEDPLDYVPATLTLAAAPESDDFLTNEAAKVMSRTARPRRIEGSVMPLSHRREDIEPEAAAPQRVTIAAGPKANDWLADRREFVKNGNGETCPTLPAWKEWCIQHNRTRMFGGTALFTD